MDIIKKILIENYGFEIIRIVPAPRGFVAETYFIDTHFQRYFVKIINDLRFADNIESSLPILYALHHQGIQNITYPIKNKDGNFSVHNDGKLYIVFNYIPGINTQQYDTKKYFKLLAKVYSKTPLVDCSQIPMEKFDKINRDQYFSHMNYFYEYGGQDEIKQATREKLLMHQDKIEMLWQEFVEAANFCGEKNKDYFITHSDGAGNVMVDGNELYIVDWDEIMMAPLERDSFFYINDKKKLKRFKKSIEKNGITCNFNNHYFKYYVCKRFFEDLSGYVDSIAESDNRINNEKMYYDMEETCFIWLYGLLKYL